MRASRSTSRIATVLTASGSFASSIALAQLGELVAFAFAELLLDRLELLAQVVLPLRVGHLLLRLRLDLALQLEQRDLARQRGGDRLELLEQVVLLEQRLLVRRLHVEQRGQHVGQAQRVVDVHDDAAQLLGEARWRATAPSRSAPGCGGRARRPRCVRSTVSGSGVICARIDVPVRVTTSARTRAMPFDDDVDAAADLRHLPDDADRADLAQVLRRRDRRSSFSCSSSRISRSPPSARLTVSIDTGRLTASGCSVSGNATVRRSGRTGSSDGSGGRGRARPCARMLSLSA